MDADAQLPATLDRIQKLRERGQSLRRMAEVLESEGFPPPGRAKKWNHMGVQWCIAQLDRPAKAEQPPAEAPQPSLKIEVYGPYTRTDRRLWTFLLKSAERELGERPIHTLPLPVVLAALKTADASPTRRHLWEAVQRLTASRITWDGKVAPRHSSVSTPLLSAHLNREEDVLLFHFCPFLVQLLRNSKESARLQLLIESKKE